MHEISYCPNKTNAPLNQEAPRFLCSPFSIPHNSSDWVLKLNRPALTMYHSVLAARPPSAPSVQPSGIQASPPHQPTTPLFSFLPLPLPLSSLYHVLPYYIS